MYKMPCRLRLAAQLSLKFYKVSDDRTWLYATFRNTEIRGKPLRAFVYYPHPASEFRSRSSAKSKSGMVLPKSTGKEMRDISPSSTASADGTLAGPSRKRFRRLRVRSNCRAGTISTGQERTKVEGAPQPPFSSSCHP